MKSNGAWFSDELQPLELKAGREHSTVKPVYNVHLIGYFSAFERATKGHLDELQKAEIASKSKLVPSVFIKTHYWINHR